MTDKRLDSNIDPEKQRLKDAIGQNAEDTELLGYAVMYTVGSDWNCLVPRDWLLDRMNDLGLPQWLAPNEPRPSSAYKRAVKRLREDWTDDSRYIDAPRLDDPQVEEPHEVTVDLKEGEGRYIWHIRAEVFFSEDEHPENPDGGEWAQHQLGYVTYDADSQSPRFRQDDDLGDDDLLHDVWMDVVNTLLTFFEEMKETHIAQDIRKMMYYSTRDYTNNVIKLRRSVYLFPAGMTDFVDQMAELYEEIDQRFKEKGEPVAVRTIEVLDLDDKREWVKQKVETSLKQSIDTILESAFEEFDEGEAADAVVKTIREDLDDDVETASTYNALLQAQLDVEEVLEEKQEEVASADHEDIIDKVLKQTDIDDF